MSDLRALAQRIERVLPNQNVRMVQLTALADSIDYVTNRNPTLFVVHLKPNRVRLIVGRLIVLTLESNHIWLATDPSHAERGLSALRSWRWGEGEYAEYRLVPSRNGYYAPSLDPGGEWTAIQSAHFSFLDRVVSRARNVDPRSRKRHEPLLLEYLRLELGRRAGGVGSELNRSEDADASQNDHAQGHAGRAPSSAGAARTEWDGPAPDMYDMSDVPSASVYAAGLDAIRHRLSELQIRLLVEQYYSENRSVTASELARLAEVRGGHPPVNRSYSLMAEWFCAETGIYPKKRANGKYRWWSVWSRGRSGEAGFVWSMRPEVAQALEQLGWVDPVAPGPGSAPDRVDGDDVFVEGSTRRVTTTARERNRNARALCIAKHGVRCSVCDMSFEEVYGEEASGFIHVHHVVPLSDADGEREVDPVEDLRPVCPNCHAVIHLGGRTRSIEEVKQMLCRPRSRRREEERNGI